MPKPPISSLTEPSSRPVLLQYEGICADAAADDDERSSDSSNQSGSDVQEEWLQPPKPGATCDRLIEDLSTLLQQQRTITDRMIKLLSSTADGAGFVRCPAYTSQNQCSRNIISAIGKCSSEHPISKEREPDAQSLSKDKSLAYGASCKGLADCHKVASRQEDCVKNELVDLINFANAKQEKLDQKHHQSVGWLTYFCPNVSNAFFEQIIDTMAGVIIAVNSIFMAWVLDNPNPHEGPWFAVKVGFATVFWIELLLKIGIFGWRYHYFGSMACSNIFDSVLVVTDSVDILLSIWTQQVPGGNTIILLRSMRLLRVIGVFRIFRAHMFHDLLAMSHALLSGAATLMWSIVFFTCFIYVSSLLTRADFGPTPGDEKKGTIEPTSLTFYFQSVPRAILTMYRCSFGDCTTQFGTPILESGEGISGLLATMLLSALIFIASVAFFNIFAALFVERIMDYAASKNFLKQRERLSDKKFWNDRVSTFIDLLLQLHEQVTYNDSGEVQPESLELKKQVGYTHLTNMSQMSLLEENFSKDVLDLSVEFNLEAKMILRELDIEPEDCLKLSSTLDMDKNGSIDILELISGLSGLRGPARRSDIVAVELAVRSMQARTDEIWLHMKQQQQQQEQTE